MQLILSRFKILYGVLSAVLILALILSVRCYAYADSATTANSDMVMGVSGIEVYDGGSTWDTIVLGEYDGSSVTWVYLGEGTNSTTDSPTYYMLSEGFLGTSVFGNSNSYYSGSVLQGVMEGFFSSTLVSSDAERSVVSATDLGDVGVSSQHFFAMSLEEVDSRYSLLGSALSKANSSNVVCWWTRSDADGEYSIFSGYMSWVISTFYDYAGGGNYSDSNYVRPAFNLATSSVLFTSAAEGSKTATGTTMTSCLTEDSISDWKLTVYDADLKLSSVETESMIMASMTIDVSYSGASCSENSTTNSLSAVIVQNDTILYYTTLIESLSEDSGTTTLTLPKDFKRLSQTIGFFVETKNGDNQTDYASEMIQLSKISMTNESTSIIDVVNPSSLSVSQGTLAADLDLPSTVWVQASDNDEREEVFVEWNTASYDEKQAGSYTLTGTLQVLEGYNPDNLYAEITVAVEESTDVSPDESETTDDEDEVEADSELADEVVTEAADESVDTSSSTDSSKLAQTGDGMSSVVLALLTMMTASAVGVLMVVRKKNYIAYK